MPGNENGATQESEGGGGSPRGAMGWVARAIVWLRFLIVPGWIAAAVMSALYLPSIFAAETGALGNLLPHSSEALQVERESREKFGVPLLTHTLVAASDREGLSPEQLDGALRYVERVDRRPRQRSAMRAVPLLNVPPIAAGKPGTTLLAFLYTDPALSSAQREAAIRDFASGWAAAADTESANPTGSVPASYTQSEIASERLTWVEIATVALVIVVLAAYFRSVGIPLLGVATVAIAYLLTSHVLGWLGSHLGVSIPEEVNPVIVALLFGTLTDYVVFIVSGYHRRLAAGRGSLQAATEVGTELLPVIVTAGTMIVGATLTLLLSGVHFLSAFGPGMAIAIAIAVVVAVTFVPAALALAGPALLWPRRPTAGQTQAPEEQTRADEHSTRGRLVGAAASRPVLTALLCALVLGAGASGLRQLEIGNPVIRDLPEDTAPQTGFREAARGFGAGIVGPTLLMVEAGGLAERPGRLAELEQGLRRQPGVAQVLGPADERAVGSYGALLTPSGNAARFAIVLDAAPNGARAIHTLANLEASLPGLLDEAGLGGAKTGIAGDTAVGAELSGDTRQAFVRIAPAAIAVLLLLLWLLLRNVRAPIYLVAVSSLVVAASLGLTVYVFQGLLGHGEIAFFVPIASAIMLLALGSDYNVFLISRIRREADRRRLLPAIEVAGSRAGRAITVAGFILAFSFAAVALIPIDSFREIAFAMSVGLLLDTLLARTFLIPALVSLFGGARSS